MITIYSTPTCSFCHAVKQYLKGRDIDFKVIDVSTDQKQLQHMVDISGQMGVPVIDIDDNIIVGFNRGALDALLRKKQLIA